MKELSIEEKAERYNKAIINGSKLWECGEITRENYEYIFTELKESKDERIKKEIIRIVKIWTNSVPTVNGIPVETLIAWLEKQGKLVNSLSKGLDNAHERIDGLIQKNNSLIEQLEKKQSDNNMGISEATKKKLEDNLNNALEKETLESCNKFLEKQGEKKYSTSQPIESEFPYVNPAETLDEEIENIWGNLSCENRFIATKDGFHEVIIHFYNWIKNQEHNDNTEPKYKVGVWLVCGDYEPEQIIGIRTNAYEMSNGDIRPFHIIDNNHNIRLWTIQDAKDGDVLATEGFVFIFKAIREDKGVGYYCANENELHEGDDSTFHVANPNSLMGSINNDFTHYTPATKEQRDLLFQKMREAGYEWDAEKKELKKIEEKPVDNVEPKLTDGFGMSQLGLTYKQVFAIEKYVERYVEFKMNEYENNDK